MPSGISVSLGVLVGGISVPTVSTGGLVSGRIGIAFILFAFGTGAGTISSDISLCVRRVNLEKQSEIVSDREVI